MMTQKENSGIRVLIVEDSRTQADYLSHILENAGYNVVVAADGIQALEKIRVDQPAIVLTDIVMPEMNGYELCHAIKQDVNLAHIPVVLVAQLFDPADLIKGLEAGADNIIIKPFEPQHVISRIKTTLQLPDPGIAGSMLDISLDGKMHHLPAHQLQTPAILLSTYDHVLKKNTELRETNESLASMNETLQKKVDSLQRANENLQLSLNARGKATDLPPATAGARELQEKDQKIRESEERFRMITELSPFPLTLIDTNGNFRFLNRNSKISSGTQYQTYPRKKTGSQRHSEPAMSQKT